MAVIFRFAALYAAIVFALGFALGMLRLLFLTPVVGELVAVILEVPVMLALAWLVSARMFPGRGLSREQGVEIGLASFLLLQVFESGLSGFFGPYGYSDNVMFYWGDLSTPRLVGLAGQILFALLPLIHILRSTPHDR
jgi:predicted Abi (CAAX) family protease